MPGDQLAGGLFQPVPREEHLHGPAELGPGRDAQLVLGQRGGDEFGRVVRAQLGAQPQRVVRGQRLLPQPAQQLGARPGQQRGEPLRRGHEPAAERAGGPAEPAGEPAAGPAGEPAGEPAVGPAGQPAVGRAGEPAGVRMVTTGRWPGPGRPARPPRRGRSRRRAAGRAAGRRAARTGWPAPTRPG